LRTLTSRAASSALTRQFRHLTRSARSPSILQTRIGFTPGRRVLYSPAPMPAGRGLQFNCRYPGGFLLHR
jgi:hypothetical protein